MKIGEVCLLTNDVPRLASFYRQLLGVEESSSDETHQFVLAEETALTVYNDGTHKNNQNQNICLAFTVDDMDKAYEKVLSLGARIIEPPIKRLWGAINMSFYDPDNSVVYLRSFQKNTKKHMMIRYAMPWDAFFSVLRKKTQSTPGKQAHLKNNSSVMARLHRSPVTSAFHCLLRHQCR